MEEANDEDNCDGQEDKAHTFEGDQLLKLHVVLVHRPTVRLLFFHCLVNRIDFVDPLIDDLAVLLLGKGSEVRQLLQKEVLIVLGRGDTSSFEGSGRDSGYKKNTLQ